MSNAINAIYEALRPLRLYRLGQDSGIDHELMAYEVAFAAAAAALDQLERQAFVQTATGSALALHEKLVGLTPRDTLGDDARRDLVLYRMGTAPFDFTLRGMVNSVRAAGMEATILEDVPGEHLTVRCVRIVDQSLELDELTASVRKVLPAHLDVTFDIGDLTWDMFEAGDVAWERWDATGMTWGDFDLNGHNIFG